MFLSLKRILFFINTHLKYNYTEVNGLLTMLIVWSLDTMFPSTCQEHAVSLIGDANQQIAGLHLGTKWVF